MIHFNKTHKTRTHVPRGCKVVCAYLNYEVKLYGSSASLSWGVQPSSVLSNAYVTRWRQGG
jgi:hypothetical protein